MLSFGHPNITVSSTSCENPKGFAQFFSGKKQPQLRAEWKSLEQFLGQGAMNIFKRDFHEK